MSTETPKLHARVFDPHGFDFNKHKEEACIFSNAVGKEQLAAITESPNGSVTVWYWINELE